MCFVAARINDGQQVIEKNRNSAVRCYPWAMTENPPSGMTPLPRHSRLRALVPAACGVALSLLTFEMAFRLLEFEKEGRDPVTHRPVVTGIHRIGEGFAVSHRDDRGIRLSPNACSHCSQVLVIGDSYTDAFQVNDGEPYTAVAETMLTGPKHIRLLNAGLTGTSPADYVVQAASYRRRINPVWVVIQLDADDLGRDAFQPYKVHFRQQGDRLTVVVPPPYGRISNTLALIRERSALANYAIARLDVARHGAKGPPWFRAGYERGVRPVAEATRPYPAERELSLLRSAYTNRVTFLFMPLFSAPVENEEIRFDRYCRETRTSCVNLRASFEEFRRTGTAPYGFPNSGFGTGHLNAAGHWAAARLLASELRRLQQNGLF